MRRAPAAKRTLNDEAPRSALADHPMRPDHSAAQRRGGAGHCGARRETRRDLATTGCL